MGTEFIASQHKPHAVFIPLPAQSHIKAMLKLAKVLHHKGFHITFVHFEINYRCLSESRGPNSMDGLPDFRFEFIPDGLPTTDTLVGPHLGLLCKSILEGDYLAQFSDLISKLNDSSSSNVPPVTCIVSDGFLSNFTIATAEEHGLPIAIFFTLSASGFMGFDQIRVLAERGLIPLKVDESFQKNGYLDQAIDFIPGMKNMRLRDFSTNAIKAKNIDEIGFRMAAEPTKKSREAPALILHTFDALEPELLDTLSSMFRAVYFIGPLQLHLNRMQQSGLRSIGCNLWKEEPECLQWLDYRTPNSVLYVNFGSITWLTTEQFIEFGMGLAKSNIPFLWIIRPDMVVGGSAILPPEFTQETRERGFIASWCPQEEVLNHPSVGGFLTHCGWGSTIESISAGMPMLCWPFIGDQPINCRYACAEWGIGMEIDNDVKSDDLAKLVTDLMEGEKGKELKNTAMEWKKMAEEATGPKGSSSLNLEKLINEILLSGKCIFQKT
ncbi:hypothetical protein K2173_009814 [Erythroxylum novogranatense]|uniref:Glycosyltransferase n=1 Tax=Erythroxylum novogranatense TaxID=1862640 RepID=A0AAV8T0F0_9ROSI|nr:hypothetical protein K2173_009814 [Erythroxylum novogranatense]